MPTEFADEACRPICEALPLMSKALDLLDGADAPSQIASHLEMAISEARRGAARVKWRAGRIALAPDPHFQSALIRHRVTCSEAGHDLHSLGFPARRLHRHRITEVEVVDRTDRRHATDVGECDCRGTSDNKQLQDTTTQLTSPQW